MSGVVFIGAPIPNGDTFLRVELDGSTIGASFVDLQTWTRLVELAALGDMFTVRTAHDEGTADARS